jgi:hypothetical protein
MCQAAILDEEGALLDEICFPNDPEGIEEFIGKLTTFHDEVRAVVESTGNLRARKMMGPGGQHIEVLGSDALQRWMQDNGVEEMNGGYWQRLPTGQLALVEMQLPKEVLEAEQLGNA